ncbi:toll/interleukin-1 receptor domain-containing protein [Rhodococcus sp. 1R11]|uniref:toll/interleukin-1 receptor domain-containing protein n=1 Tax=Rhodococcus sp. 1R11 TaxID=2559614 RepID=UPI001072444F|nr:toll/interleukin-1 receptor domain-containing protein [Rhodococcus sp. 1R11]TFI43571.1 toll/interleukin-1 receptor domain-containing protein [Rhodococcus sp. 1R11]
MDPELMSPAGVSNGGDPPRVFLSYAHEDQAVAELVSSALSSKGIEVWTDRKIAYGESVASAIGTGIDAADVILVLMSPASSASQWVSTEVAMAVANTLGGLHKRVLPVLIDGNSHDSVPPLLTGHQYLDLRNEVWNSSGLDKLVDEVFHGKPANTKYDAGRAVTKIETEILQRTAREQEAAFAASSTIFSLARFASGYMIALAIGASIAVIIMLVYGSAPGGATIAISITNLMLLITLSFWMFLRSNLIRKNSRNSKIPADFVRIRDK